MNFINVLNENSNMRKAIIIALTGIAGLFQSISAQQANTMYFMKENPLYHTLNPAFQPESRFYFGIPGISSIDFGVGNNSFIFSDICYPYTDSLNQKKTGLFMHPEIGLKKNGIDNFLKAHRKNLRVFQNVEVTLLSFGFKSNKSFYSFDISTKEEFQLIMPKAFTSAIFKGVENPEGITDFALDKLSLSSIVYTQAALGYAYNMDEKWQFGGKVKLLFGHANLATDFSNLKLQISKEEWLLKGNSSLSASAPGLTIKTEEDDEGNETFNFDFDDNIKVSKAFSNFGMALDLGASYKILDNLQASVSVIDLGLIHWGKNVQQVTQKSDFVFDGIKNYDINDTKKKYFEEYGDELKSMYQVEKKPSSYNTWLTAKVYAGVEYSLWDNRMSFGLLSKTYITQQRLFEDMTISYNFRPFYPVALSLSYSLLDGRWSNIGAGVNLNLGPINLFVISDNIPFKFAKGNDSGLMLPTGTQATHVSVGLNFILGPKKEKEPKSNLVYAVGNPTVIWPDEDGDGIPDKDDKCPGTPRGVAVDKDGCPLDSDGDGVPDYLDRCPDTPAGAKGFVNEHGCELDTDNDGVCDYKDKCPDTPAEVGTYVDDDGCTLDSDGDGVPDYMDKCPKVPGTPENNGCPEVKEAAKEVFKKALNGIEFESGKDVIKRTSNKILDEVATIMIENPAYQLFIYGHTDNSGNAAKNQTLSEERANAVKNYLIAKGVAASRLEAQGFGQDQPIADNKTAAGRAKNRRVEFIVHF